MEEKKSNLINDSVDFDTLFIVLMNKLDFLIKVFLLSLAFFILFFIFDQRVYQSSSLINFEKDSSSLTSLPGFSSFQDPGQTNLAGEKEIYKSISTISGAREKIINDKVIEDVPSVEDIINGLSFSNNENLLTVKFRHINKEDTRIILDYLNNEFLIDSVESKQLKAKKGIEFIKNEIPKINELLTEAEDDLTDYKENSGKYVIFDNEDRADNLQSLENRIKEIEFKEVELKEFYKSTHPIYLTLIQQKNLLQREIEDLEKNIKDVPTEQRTLFKFQQKVNIYSSSLETLEKQKLDLNLSAASSLSNIRIVNNATEAQKISPSLSIILFSLVIFSLFYIFFLVEHLITDKILSIDALLGFLASRKSFIGAFPLKQETKDVKSKILEDIEENNLDRSVISILNSKDKVNIVTSMKGGVGKTYFCLKLSKKLVALDKKVCILDFDLRKKGISFENKGNLTDLQYISFEDFENEEREFDSCIIKQPNIDDPIKFLSSEKISNVIEKLREKFDFVLIDTPPVGTFVDAKLLSSQVDSAIIILASHLSTFAEIESIQKEFNTAENKEVEMKYFLNKVKYYLEIFRFKIRYPYYGHYSYYDSYYYANDDKNKISLKSFWNFLSKLFRIYKKKLLDLLRKK